jgi:hypothetical protein
MFAWDWQGEQIREFSPKIGRLFTLGSVLKITQVAEKKWLLLFYGTSCSLILTKKLVGIHFWRLFQKLV